MPKKTSINQRLCTYMRSHGFVIDRRNNFENYVSVNDLYKKIQNPPAGKGSPTLQRLSIYGLTQILNSDTNIVKKQSYYTDAPLFESSEENEKLYSYIMTVPNSKNNAWRKHRFSNP